MSRVGVSSKREYWRLRTAQWRKTNPEKWKIIQERYRKAHPERMVESYKMSYRKHREKRLVAAKKYRDDGHHRKNRTGHSPQYFSEQLAKQNSRCAICKKLVSGKGAHADHNHLSKKPRGVLCLSCNMGIGLFHEDVDMLLAAVAYLRKWDLIAKEIAI